MLYLHICKD